jgi:V8-like Glu-specific endopeptidase
MRSGVRMRKADGQRISQRISQRLRWAIGTAVTASGVMTVAVLSVVLIWPAGHGAGRLVIRAAAALRMAPGHAAPGRAVTAHGRPFGGTPAVGALFTQSNGRLGDHFCTASVVHSRHGDLLVTAAHCLTGRQVGRADGIVFVPGFHDGQSPYGAWRITAVFVDRAWSARHDPDDDVAFLHAGAPGSQIEKATGAERLGVGRPPQAVRVIGYPDRAARPVTCRAPARGFSARQMVFDCDGYTDGTSGGPFLADVSRTTGRGTVIGVIGGYQQGGDTPDISYSPRFLANVAALYEIASRH